eukprot:55848-Eustigmatos_ZCMA.PRE.1
MSNLQELWLGRNAIGIRGAEHIAEALPSLSRLREVALGKNPLGDRGCEIIINSLAEAVGHRLW